MTARELKAAVMPVGTYQRFRRYGLSCKSLSKHGLRGIGSPEFQLRPARLLDSFVADGQRCVAIRQHVAFWHARCTKPECCAETGDEPGPELG